VHTDTPASGGIKSDEYRASRECDRSIEVTARDQTARAFAIHCAVVAAGRRKIFPRCEANDEIRAAARVTGESRDPDLSRASARLCASAALLNRGGSILSAASQHRRGASSSAANPSRNKWLLHRNGIETAKRGSLHAAL